MRKKNNGIINFLKDAVLLENFYLEELDKTSIGEVVKVTREEQEVYNQNKLLWDGKISLKIDKEFNYLPKEKFINENKLSIVDKQDDINKQFDKIINIVTKKIKIDTKKNRSFLHFKEHDKKYLNKYERNKIKKYLNRYFKLKRYPILFKLSGKTNKNLDKQINKLCSLINRPKPRDYDRFMSYGRVFYNLDTAKNIVLPQETIISKNEEKMVIEKKPDNSLKEDKKVNIKKKLTTEEVKKLNSDRLKLLYKVRKIEKELKNTKELIEYKNEINKVEENIFYTKLEDERFKETIKNSREIRKEKALKSINVYFNRYNKGKIKETIEDYFGLDQIAYFKSLGIDIDNMFKVKTKVK